MRSFEGPFFAPDAFGNGDPAAGAPSPEVPAVPEGLIRYAVAVPAIQGGKYNYLAMLDLPAAVDFEDMWIRYNNRSGRVDTFSQRGHSHKQVHFDEWVLAQFPHRSGRQRAGVMSSEFADEEFYRGVLKDLETIGVSSERCFVPAFSKLNPYLK